MHLKSMSKELKNCIETLVGQALFKFDHFVKNCLAYSSFNAIWGFLWQFPKDAYFIFQEGVDNFEIGYKAY